MSGLKLFVPVKRVVDYAVKIRIRPDKTGSCARGHTRGVEDATVSLTALALCSLPARATRAIA